MLATLSGKARASAGDLVAHAPRVPATQGARGAHRLALGAAGLAELREHAHSSRALALTKGEALGAAALLRLEERLLAPLAGLPELVAKGLESFSGILTLLAAFGGKLLSRGHHNLRFR